MSVKLVARIHPFDPASRIVKEIEPTPLHAIYADLRVPLPIGHARFMINDRRVYDPKEIPVDGDMVFVSVAPGGGMDAQDMGSAEKIGGALITAVGVVLMFVPGGQAFGVGLIGSGIGMIAGGVVLYNTDFSGQLNESPESAISLRGSRNKTNLGGATPLVLGTHRIAPHNGAAPYTEIVGTDQYLHQLFIVGSSRTVIDADSWKIGDTPLSEYDNVDIVPEASGATLANYPYIVRETTVGRLLAKLNSAGLPGDIVVSTPANTRKIILDLAFNGLIKYESDGDKRYATVRFDVFYKLSGAPDSAYVELVTDRSTKKTTKVHREVIQKTFDNEAPGGTDYNALRKYDVRIRRITDDSDKSNVIDKCYVGSLRSIEFARPINAAVQADLCVAALRIKASDQLAGVIDQLSCVASSAVLDYNGAGSGIAAWSTRATSNPASLYLHVLTDPKVNPRPKPYTAVNWPELESWHAFCAAKGYECNMVVDSDVDRDTLLVQIAQCGRATPVKVGGKYYCVIDRARAAPMQMLTPRNSWDYSGSKSFPDFPHALKVNFINRDIDYQEDQVIVYDDGYNADGSGGKTFATRFQEIDLKGVVTAAQAWKEGRYKIAAARLRPETHQITAPAEYLTSTIGDWVKFSHDVIEVGHAWPRIVDTTVVGDMVTGVRIDELVLIEAGKEYAIEIRTVNSIIAARVTAPLGLVQDLTFLEPIPESAGVETGNLAPFGEAGLVSIDAVLMDIQPQSNLSARLTLVEYAPAIFDLIDNPALEIPPHDPKMSKPGSGSGAPVITSVYDPAAAIEQLREALDGPSAMAGTSDEIPADVSALAAVAGPDEIHLDCEAVSGLNARTSAVGYIYQRSTDGGTTWRDIAGLLDGLSVVASNRYSWAFNRAVDGYPEPLSADTYGWPGLDQYRFRVKAINIAGAVSLNWQTLSAVDSSQYGTWLPPVPGNCVGSSSGRTAKIDWSDSTVYGLLRYEVQIAPESVTPTWYQPQLGLDVYADENNYRQSSTPDEKRHVSVSQFTHSLPLTGQNDDPPDPADTAYLYRVRAVSSRAWSEAPGCEETEDGYTAGPWSAEIPVLARATSAYDLAHGSILKDALSAENLAVLFGYMAVLSGGIEDENNQQVLSDYPGRTLPVGYHRWGDDDFKVEFNPTTRKYYIGFVDSSKYIEFDADAGTFTFGGVELKIENDRLIAYQGTGLERTAVVVEAGSLSFLDAIDGQAEEVKMRIRRPGTSGARAVVDKGDLAVPNTGASWGAPIAEFTPTIGCSYGDLTIDPDGSMVVCYTNTNSYVAFRRKTNGVWSAEQNVKYELGSSHPRRCLLPSGEHAIVWGTYYGAAYSLSISVSSGGVFGAGSAFMTGAVEVSALGLPGDVILLAYRLLSDNYIYIRTWTAGVLGAPVAITNYGAMWPKMINDGDGNIRIVFQRISDYKIQEALIVNMALIGSIVNVADGTSAATKIGFAKVSSGDYVVVFYRTSGSPNGLVAARKTGGVWGAVTKAGDVGYGGATEATLAIDSIGDIVSGYNASGYKTIKHQEYISLTEAAARANSAVLPGTDANISITGSAENVKTPTAGYKHVGAWGVGRTGVGAILVNTAYTADVATNANALGGVALAGVKGHRGHYLVASSTSDDPQLFYPGVSGITSASVNYWGTSPSQGIAMNAIGDNYVYVDRNNSVDGTQGIIINVTYAY